MKIKEFFGKFVNAYLWGNLLAMALVVAVLCFGVKYGLEIYTHHGEGIKVPQLVNMTTHNARVLLLENGLELVVNDSGYNKRLPADCILAQSPGAGMMVKSGHVIYVTVNSPSSPSFAIPDLIDNSSYREAEAKLMALGFRLLPPKRIEGERDWVYGIVSRGRQVNTGDHVSIETPLTLLIGNGRYGEDEDINYTEPDIVYPEERLDGFDEFEEVAAPDQGQDTETQQEGSSDGQY
jgi:beta-lactam-binding protein with PASTA domain